MKHLKYILLLISIIACVQDNLPKPTKIGANTFGCKVDGREWIPNGGGGFSGLKKILGRNYEKSFSIITHKSDKSDMTLNFNKPIVLGKIDFKRYNIAQYRTDVEIYETNEIENGYMNITKFDSTSRIISGTFEFQCRSNKSNKIVKVSNGRFDIKY